MTDRRHRRQLPLGGEDGLPFSKGMMARALIAAGISTDRAYELALAVEAEIGESDRDTRTDFDELRLRKRLVRARTPGQDAYLRALKRETLVFATGPAGTGKTWLAVAHAIHRFERREIDREAGATREGHFH